MLAHPATNVTNVNPVAYMSQNAIPAVLGSTDMALGLVGAMTMYGYILQYGTNAEFVKSAGTGEKPDPRTMAKSYADNVLSVLGNSEFNNFLTAIIRKTLSKGQGLNQKQQGQAAATVKVILLASALQPSTRRAGGFSGKEFAAMLADNKASTSPTIVLNESDPKRQFVYLIQKLMSPDFMEATQSDNLKAALVKYFDDFTQKQKETAMDTLTKPTKVLAGVFSTLPKSDLEA